jgi:tetratricopeptide (TPR) repeat protein
MSISADHEPLEPAVPAQQIADITARLEELDTVSGGSAESLTTPRDFLNRAVELMCAENHRGALDTLLTGWNQVERLRDGLDDDFVLAYMSAIVDRASHVQETALSEAWIRRRLAHLRELGRFEQADVEASLGVVVHREPRAEDMAALEAAVTPLLDSDASVPARLVWGVGLGMQGRYAQSVEVLESVREYLRRTGQEQAECNVMFLVEDAYVHLGDEETALEYISHVIDHSVNRAAVATLRMKRARLNIGASRKIPGILYDLLSALETYTEAGIRGGAVVAAMSLGQQLQEIEAYDAAAAAYTAALDHAERGESPFVPQVMTALGNALVQAGHPARSVVLLRRFLDMPEPTDGSQATERAAAYNTMAYAHVRLDENAKAAEAWTESVERFLDVEDADSASAAASNVARLAFVEGELDVAASWIQSALDIVEEHGLHPLQGSEHLAFFSTVLAKRGKPEALEIIDRALAEAERFEAPFHTAQYLETKAMVLFDLGRVDEAVAGTLSAGDAYAAIGVPSEGARCDIRAADLLRHKERLVEAASVYRSAIDRSPDRADYMFAAYRGLAVTLEKLGQLQEAASAGHMADEWAAKARAQGMDLD